MASYVKRAGVAVAEATKLEEMTKKGLQVYSPTPAEKRSIQESLSGRGDQCHREEDG